MASEFASSSLSALWSKSCLSSSVMRQISARIGTHRFFASCRGYGGIPREGSGDGGRRFADSDCRRSGRVFRMASPSGMEAPLPRLRNEFIAL